MSDVQVDDVYIDVDGDGNRVIVVSLNDGTDIGIMHDGLSINGSQSVGFESVVQTVLGGGGDG